VTNAWISDEDYNTAIHEAAHAVAVEWTGAGRVERVEIGLLRTRPQGDVKGAVHWRGVAAGREADLLGLDPTHPLIEARLIVHVAGPLAVARVTGKRDSSWASWVEAHLRYDLDPGHLPSGPIPDYVNARRVCRLLGLTLAEGLELGETFLDQPGVMAAVNRVAWAVLDSAPAYRLDRPAFLAALQLPAAIQERYEAVHGAAQRALVRHYARYASQEEESGVPFLLLWVVVHLLWSLF
jgi:hypothetical protein